MKCIGHPFFLILLALSFWHGIVWATPSTDGIQVYNKNVHLSDAHKQRLAADIDHFHNANNLWDTLSQEFILPHYENHPAVKAQIDYFMNHQEFLVNSATRAAPYLYFILQQTKKRHLPAEIALLPIIESGFNPFAVSNKGAVGLWQIMPATATGFGVKQNGWFDGRRDIVASTRAALDFLSYLSNLYKGNWLLAIAAYNTGEGNVGFAQKKNRLLGKSTDFWALPLAEQSRIYVPRLLALAVIISHPEEYPIALPPVSNSPYLAQIDIGTQIDLKHAAELAGLNPKKLLQLNSGHKKATTDPEGPFKIVLPLEHVQQFTENFERLYSEPDQDQGMMEIQVAKKSEPNELSAMIEAFKPRYDLQPGDTLYMVREGDTLPKIAERFHTNVKTLSDVNHLDESSYLSSGDKIIVPTHLAQQGVKQEYELAKGQTVYSVQQGDNIEGIAKKFNTSSAAIRLANLLTGNELQVGDRLVVPVHSEKVG